MSFTSVACSLADLVGANVVTAAATARAYLTGVDPAALVRLGTDRVEFFPESLQRRLRQFLPQAGQVVGAPLTGSPTGAGSRGFAAATKSHMAPVSGLGYFRVGEDGRLYVISKSEHYHAPLGHSFPGYQLLERARALGIPNATHNNTRGPITRRLEEELVRLAGGGLNRVLNLETGSLAAEAAFKLVLGRFYRHELTGASPLYAGRTPVFLVMGDDDGAVTGNYHGTTNFTQVLRGLWPELRTKLEATGVMRVVAIRPNSIADLDAAFRQFEQAPFKIAGFFHEIVMMNYGARRLTEEFLQHAHRLCAAHDVPTVVDEIQSCMWYDGLFLFRQYGLQPTMVVLGKGFPGGEYPASRILFNERFDSLPQFGALVTNGQEELASLAYLITMRWTQANGSAITAAGQRLETGCRQLAGEFPDTLAGVEGHGHLLGLRFADMAHGQAFVAAMNAAGFDISVQSYKAECPPVALTKLPTIADDALIDYTLQRMRDALTTSRNH
ncbi:MAG: Acetylornithine/succinyldiaminopimelate aminotransferase [Verrucomicrobiae bacterium]|nr:Acetylornithine/succinyldiaminopimelate aminotransferase [Verrucomicrobiae bacterium]